MLCTLPLVWSCTDPLSDTPEVASGAYWMHRGVDVELNGDFQAAAFTLERVAGGTAER